MCSFPLYIWPELLEAWLALASVNYHRKLLELWIPLNQWSALTMPRATGPEACALVMEIAHTTVEKNTDQGGNWTHNLCIRSLLLIHLFSQIKVVCPFDNWTAYHSATEEKLWRYFNFTIVITAKFRHIAACSVSLPRDIRLGLKLCCVDVIIVSP